MSVHKLDSLWKTCYLFYMYVVLDTGDSKMNIIQPLPLTSSHSERKDSRVQGYEYPGQGPGGKHDSVVTPATVDQSGRMASHNMGDRVERPMNRVG